MSHLTDDEQRDEFIAQRQVIRAAEIRTKLAAGDKEMTDAVDEQIGGLLFNGDKFSWAQLIKGEAEGKREFVKLLDAAIAVEAENMALKDTEQVERENPIRRRTYPRNYGAPM